MLAICPLKDVRTEYCKPGTVVHALALALEKSSSSVQQEPRESSKSLCYLIWWRSGSHLIPSTHTPKKQQQKNTKYSMQYMGTAPHPAYEEHAPDGRWTLELNSSVIELKLKLTPCCSGPHLFRESCRSVCHFRGLERLFRGRMKESAAVYPVQSARSASLPGSATSNELHTAPSKIVFDDPCPPSLVPPTSSVASCRSHRRGTHSEEVVLSHSSPRYASNQRAGIRMAPGSAPREETGQGYYASCTGACLHAQKLLGGPPG